MPRETFDRELQRLQDELLILGSLVETAISDSMDALKQQDLEAARKVVMADRPINEKRFQIESDTLILMATQQPMAVDLRVLASVLEISTELERIGDYAKGIAKITLRIGNQPLVKPLIDLPRMAERARSMLHRALDAFVRRDVELARAVPEEDSEMDALYNQIYRELLTFIMADPSTIDQATMLLWVGHNLERSADRVTNICERVVFTVTGKMVEMDGEGREDTGIEGLH
jgi:phosphate transport system protein